MVMLLSLSFSFCCLVKFSSGPGFWGFYCFFEGGCGSYVVWEIVVQEKKKKKEYSEMGVLIFHVNRCDFGGSISAACSHNSGTIPAFWATFVDSKMLKLF